MEFEQVRPFLENNHRGVVTTFQRDGAVQASIVVCGPYQGHLAFVSVRGRSAKVRNLRRDPRCTVVATAADWRSYVVVEGEARLLDAGNAEGEELRRELAFRASRLKKLREAKATPEEEAQEQAQAQGKKHSGVPPEKAQRNFTDPDSRIMPVPGARSLSRRTTARRRWTAPIR